MDFLTRVTWLAAVAQKWNSRCPVHRDEIDLAVRSPVAALEVAILRQVIGCGGRAFRCVCRSVDDLCEICQAAEDGQSSQSG